MFSKAAAVELPRRTQEKRKYGFGGWLFLFSNRRRHYSSSTVNC